MLGLALTAILFIGGLIAWCQLVPDREARLRGVIALWILFVLVDVALFFANRSWHFY